MGATGCAGWSYEDVLPYFKRSEQYHGGDTTLHSSQGELTVSKLPHNSAVTEACLDAAVQAGHPRNDDFNGEQQDGFGTYDFNLRDGRRWTTALAYLYPALKRSNINIIVGALTQRVVVDNGRATGVEFLQGSTVNFARARREVILCGGAINSPQIMMLSGLGDAAHLRDLGIPVVRDMPSVGRNMQDHLYVLMGYDCLKPVSLIHDLRFDKLMFNMMNAYLRGPRCCGASPLKPVASSARGTRCW